MANVPERWAIREAAEATFYDLKTGKHVVSLKTLKMTEVNTTGETTYAIGGRGGAKLVGFSGNKEAKVTLQDAIFDNKALAMIMGTDLKAKASRDKLVSESVTAEDTGSFPISNLDITTLVKYTINDGEELKSGTPASGIITDEDVKTGDKITATYNVPLQAVAFDVTAKDFAKAYKLVVDVVVRDLETSEDFYGQIIIPKAQIENDFTMSFAPDGDPSVMDIPIEILKDTNSDLLYQMLLFENE